MGGVFWEEGKVCTKAPRLEGAWNSRKRKQARGSLSSAKNVAERSELRLRKQVRPWGLVGQMKEFGVLTAAGTH